MSLKTISAWSITHPVPTTVLFLILAIAGMCSFFGLGIDESPNIDIPTVTVTVNQPGAAPSELETQVARKIEDAVAGIGNIKHMMSTLNEGSSITTIEFELGTNSERAVNDVRNEISKIRQLLPKSIDEPIVQRVDFAGGSFLTYSVSSKTKSVEQLSWIVDNDIARSLLSVAGVGQVQRSGGVDREIRVSLDPTRLNALGTSADLVSMQIAYLNTDLPGGRGELGSREQSIRTLGSAPTVANLAEREILLSNGSYARLNTIGTVADSTSDQRQSALLNGDAVVAFSIVRSMGSNMIDVEKAVDAKMVAIKKALPADVDVKLIRTQARFVRDSYSACIDSLIIGASLAIFVIWLFLRDWRAAVISALAMPLSLIPAFAIMKGAGFTLNNMSLLGLSLVIGVLVDDAIVEIENIVRHMHLGKKPFQAAFDAADEIGLAVVATTMTIVVVFVPVGFMGGIPGQFLKQFGLTVAAAVLFSLLVARMLTPLMAAYFLKKNPEHSSAKDSKLSVIYRTILTWSLAHRGVTIALAIGFFVGSIMLMRTLPTSVIGNVDRSESLLTVQLPPGATLGKTISVVKELTAKFKQHPEVTQIFATIGSPSTGSMSGTSSAGEVNNAKLYVALVPRDKRKISQMQFEQLVRPELNQVPGARLAFTAVQGITGKLKVVLTSNDQADLASTSEALEHQMRDIPGLYDIQSNESLKRPEILVRPHFSKAAQQGVSVQQIARTAMVATLGDADASLPKYNLADRQINIRVQLDPKYRSDLETIRNLRVLGKNNRLVPLSSVSEVTIGSGPSEIDRLDRERQVSIEASLSPDLPLGKALELVHQLPAYKSRPASITDTPSGDSEIQRDIFSGFGWALGTAVILIYAVLVLLFDSYLHPLTIMMSLPLALGGALIGLVIAHQSMGFYALIGIVMLMGLVTKNSILLVEYCLGAMKEGKSCIEAIVESGETRMRPILMTTVAMIVGMLPIALGIGAGAEARAPMAICVVGGLVTSTLLTLIVVPVVFTYIDALQNRLYRFLPKPDKGTLAVNQPSATQLVVAPFGAVQPGTAQPDASQSDVSQPTASQTGATQTNNQLVGSAKID